MSKIILLILMFFAICFIVTACDSSNNTSPKETIEIKISLPSNNKNIEIKINMTEQKNNQAPTTSKNENYEIHISNDQISAARKRELPVYIVNDFENAEAIKMVYIPSGDYTMGSSHDEVEKLINKYGNQFREYLNREKPQHKVTIKKDFYICLNEVTVGQFKQFVAETDYLTEAEKGEGSFAWTGSKWEMNNKINWRNPGFVQKESHPVVCVSWNDAKAYIKWLNKKYKTNQFRLPTEAEWEYVCRAGSTTRYFFGDDDSLLSKHSEFQKENDDHKGTWPIGKFKPNLWGLHDMYGNVWEWCEDKSHINYSGAPDTGKSWTERPITTGYIVRGGGWHPLSIYLRSSARANGLASDSRYTNVGFRIVKDIKKK